MIITDTSLTPKEQPLYPILDPDISKMLAPIKRICKYCGTKQTINKRCVNCGANHG